jgi:hypothetical protein
VHQCEPKIDGGSQNAIGAAIGTVGGDALNTNLAIWSSDPNSPHGTDPLSGFFSSTCWLVAHDEFKWTKIARQVTVLRRGWKSQSSYRIDQL